MSDPYDDILADPRSVLYTLNSSIFTDVPNCPDTADAVDDFLRTGQRVEADVAHSRFRIQAHFRNATWGQITQSLLQLGHGHHYVIRGTRPPGSPLTSTHYFVVANIQSQVVLIDAYTHELLRTPEEFAEYRQRGQFHQLAYTEEFEATVPPPRARRSRRSH
jgi:hypothetical protein